MPPSRVPTAPGWSLNRQGYPGPPSCGYPLEGGGPALNFASGYETESRTDHFEPMVGLLFWDHPSGFPIMSCHGLHLYVDRPWPCEACHLGLSRFSPRAYHLYAVWLPPFPTLLCHFGAVVNRRASLPRGRAGFGAIRGTWCQVPGAWYRVAAGKLINGLVPAAHFL